MKQILVYTTGGTILSLSSEHGLKPSDESIKLRLMEKIQPLSGEYEITIESIFNKDSSNITPYDWHVAYESIKKHVNSFDGIVILHGTDTMSYSSAMLSYMFSNIQKAIIVTGAQYPIDFPNSDGTKNLQDAIIAAGDPRLAGVYIVFHNKIINGTRGYKRSSINKDAYISCNYPYVGFVHENKVILTREYKKRHKIANYEYHPNHSSYVSTSFPKVFMLKMVPGIDSNIFDYIKREGYHGVVIEGYGLGGMPTEDDRLLQKMDELIQSAVPIVMTTQCLYDGVSLDTYEVGVTVNRIGVISAYDMTPDAAYTKLLWILGHTRNYNEILTAFRTNYCGEVAEK